MAGTFTAWGVWRVACAGPSPQGASSVSTPVLSFGPQQTGRASFVCLLCDPESDVPVCRAVWHQSPRWREGLVLGGLFPPCHSCPREPRVGAELSPSCAPNPPHGDEVSYCPHFTERETEAQRF